jgi:hypothetical protein
MSQRAGQGEFVNSSDINEALKNKNRLTTKSMKARLLKEIGKKGTIGGMYFAKDSIIDVDVPMGGKIVYTNNVSTGRKDYPLTIGTDVELIPDNKNDDKVIPLNKMTTKVRALRDLNLGGRGIVAQTKKQGDIFFINDNQPLGGGGKTLYYKTLLHDSEVPLVLGQDIELVNDNPIESIVTKKQTGSLLFYGGLLALGYIVYKVINTK